MGVGHSMLGTPASIAATPDHPPDGRDVLAEMLRAVRLTGSVFLDARFSSPFGVVSPRRFDAVATAHMRHISVFHLIAAGGCTIETSAGERRAVSTGDILLLPFADEHRFWNGVFPPFARGPDLFRPGPVSGMWHIDHGGGGQVTRMVCGFIESADTLFAPVFRSLPTLLVEQTGEDPASALITETVRQILTLADAATPGTDVMLGRLMELLFLEVLRRHALRLPADAKGWLAALNDPILRRALSRLHDAPSRPWTVDELAQEAGTSRTVLAERFKAVLGQAPIQYVTGWRMQLAADRLRNGRDSLAAIAQDVGYESEAAFNRAFKRVTGVSPGRWRNDALREPPPS